MAEICLVIAENKLVHGGGVGWGGGWEVNIMIAFAALKPININSNKSISEFYEIIDRLKRS